MSGRINILLRWVCTKNMDVIGARYSEISLPIIPYWFLKVDFYGSLGRQVKVCR